jgi:hypothetical protein
MLICQLGEFYDQYCLDGNKFNRNLPLFKLTTVHFINNFFRKHGSTTRQCSSRSALRRRCQQSLRRKTTTFQSSLLTVKTRKSLSSKSTTLFIIIKTEKLKLNSKLFDWTVTSHSFFKQKKYLTCV